MLDIIGRLEVLQAISTDSEAGICKDAIKHIKAVETRLKTCSADRLGMKASLDSAARIITEKDTEITRLEFAVRELGKLAEI